MFSSNLEYINDNVSGNDNEDFSEKCDCIYRQCRSSDTNTSDSDHPHFWLVLGRDTDFCASMLILFADRMCVRRWKYGICFVLLYRLICILSVASQREKSIGPHCARLPTGAAEQPGLPGGLDRHRGGKRWWEAQAAIRGPGGPGQI